MNFPSLLDIWTRMRNSMRAFLPGTDAWIEPNNLSIAGRSFTLTMGSAYERMAYIYKQIFASTADDFHLQYRHAFEWGISRLDPSPAQGYFDFTLTGAPYNTIPAGYEATRSDGIVFAFLGDAVPDNSGNCSVEVRATTTGSVTNTLPNTPLNFAPDPDYPNLPASGTVDADGLGGGADQEEIPHLRKRVLLRKRMPPHGGSASDWQQWLLGVPGVTRAFVSPFITSNPNAGCVPLTLFPLFDLTRVNGIPTQADLAFVAAQVETDQPVTSKPYFVAAAPTPVNITISNLASDSPALRQSIIANLTVLFATKVPVVTAGNQFTLPVAWLNGAIMRAKPSYSRHTLVAPSADVTFTPGQLPTLGTVNFS